LTRDFDEFVAVREELLLRIMNFVGDSGTRFASPSQTLYLSGAPSVGKDKINVKSVSFLEGLAGHGESETAARDQMADGGKNGAQE
jgi:hypothetical protein